MLSDAYLRLVSLNVLSILQALIVVCLAYLFSGAVIHLFSQGLGYLAGGLIVAYRVTHGQNSPSDFVIFVAYLTQVRSRTPFGLQRLC